MPDIEEAMLEAESLDEIEAATLAAYVMEIQQKSGREAIFGPNSLYRHRH